jgi:hypothetical protein
LLRLYWSLLRVAELLDTDLFYDTVQIHLRSIVCSFGARVVSIHTQDILALGSYALLRNLGINVYRFQ